jgi:hypothetical protein
MLHLPKMGDLGSIHHRAETLFVPLFLAIKVEELICVVDHHGAVPLDEQSITTLRGHEPRHNLLGLDKSFHDK